MKGVLFSSLGGLRGKVGVLFSTLGGLRGKVGVLFSTLGGLRGKDGGAFEDSEGVYWVSVSESFDAPDKESLNGCCVVL